MCEDESAFLRQQFVLLHSEFLQELPSGHREDGLEQAAAEHLGGFVARQAVVTLGDVAVAKPPENRTAKNTDIVKKERGEITATVLVFFINTDGQHTEYSPLYMLSHHLSGCAGDIVLVSPASSNLGTRGTSWRAQTLSAFP